MRLKLKMAVYERFPSQAEAAAVFGMREDRLSRIVRGRVPASKAERILIAKMLGRKVQELFPDAPAK